MANDETPHALCPANREPNCVAKRPSAAEHAGMRCKVTLDELDGDVNVVRPTGESPRLEGGSVRNPLHCVPVHSLQSEARAYPRRPCDAIAYALFG